MRTAPSQAKQAPLVSVGLAVYNGEKYLRQAIDSILAQTFTDFELIISDNASIDRTAEICQEYAAQDPRIRYSRNAENIGGANNENLTFRLSHGKYFRLAAHDDVCAPLLLEKCVRALEADPSIVLCHTIVVDIDEMGNPLRTVNTNRATSPKPHERLREMATLYHGCEETYGLIRADVMRKTALEMNYTDSDRSFLSELCLYGKFQIVPEPLFFRRTHAEMSTRVYPDWYQRMEWFDPKNKYKITFPNWQQFFHYLRMIARAPLPFDERVKCYQYMLYWLTREYHGRWLVKDLLLGIRKLPSVLSRKVGMQ